MNGPEALLSKRALSSAMNSLSICRPAAIIRDLDLRCPIYRQTAAYGRFDCTDIDLPWERTDKADAIREDAGL
jgi:S-adenosylmethionine synthetase